MYLVFAIDVLAVGWLVAIAFTKGFERALPVTAFLIMLFPVESQIRPAGLFDLTTQRLIIATLVIIYLALGRTQKNTGQKEKLPLKNLLLLLLAWMLLSSANSVVPEVSFKSFLSQFFDFFVLYYIFAKTVSKAETIHKCLFGLVAAMFVCSIFGCLEAYLGWSILSIFPPAPHRFANMVGAIADRDVRAQSTFGHAILFGAALAMAIPLALYLVSVAKTRVQRLFLWSAIMLMFMCIYKTSSRGPWMALALSLGMLVVLGQGKLRKYVMVIALLTLTVLLARPGVWTTIENLYAETLNPETAQGQSYQWRYVLFDLAKRELSKDFGRALWGYGPESFFYLGLEGDFQGERVKFESCDSAVVELMMDTGYVGFLLVAVLLLKAAFLTFRGFRRMPEPASSLCLAILINICAFCFLMTNVELFGWGQQNYMLWILIALAMIYPRIAAVDSPAQDRVELAGEMVPAATS